MGIARFLAAKPSFRRTHISKTTFYFMNTSMEIPERDWVHLTKQGGQPWSLK